jgi:CBS domain containing-hemolysin-like protein
MVPRTELTAVEADAPREVLLDALSRANQPRVPVYRHDLDNIVGMLEVTDAFKAVVVEDGKLHAGSLARETITVPQTLRADEVLAAIRRRNVREAVVIDEYGGTAGLVTFESLMERIVGDLGDALGGAGRITVRPDGSAEIDGLALVTDLNEQFALDIDEDTYTTIGGYALGRLGRRARAGDAMEVGGREMRVTAVDGLRVSKVWLSTPRNPVTDDSEDEQ